MVGRASGKHVSLPSDARHRHETHARDRPDVGAVKVSATATVLGGLENLRFAPHARRFSADERRTQQRRRGAQRRSHARYRVVVRDRRKGNLRRSPSFSGLRLGEQLTLGGRESKDSRGRSPISCLLGRPRHSRDDEQSTKAEYAERMDESRFPFGQAQRGPGRISRAGCSARLPTCDSDRRRSPAGRSARRTDRPLLQPTFFYPRPGPPDAPHKALGPVRV